jgi:hypothetical protein
MPSSHEIYSDPEVARQYVDFPWQPEQSLSPKLAQIYRWFVHKDKAGLVRQARERVHGNGPKYIKRGNAIVYTPRLIDEFYAAKPIAAEPVQSGAEYFARKEQAGLKTQQKEPAGMQPEAKLVAKRATKRRTKANEVRAERAA